MNFSKKNHEYLPTIQMMLSKTRLTFLLVFLSGILLAQNGINYKAVIKDTNGNVVANQGIDIVFSIQHESVSIYSELQQIVTDNNGIAIATIGDGSAITGTFDTIDWKLRDLELNVQIDFSDGLVDFGNTQFNAVPYALNTLKPQGLQALDEGNGIGWRLSKREANNYGDIGEYAVDLSISNSGSDLYGATGNFSFAAGGSTIASSFFSTALGDLTIASGPNSTAMGYLSEASANSSTAMGSNSKASGFASLATGYQTASEAYASTAIGAFNVGGGNATNWELLDPLFEIGNGSSISDRSNALTIYKNGRMTINSSSNGLEVNSEGSYGVVISSLNNYGVRVFGANEYGGRFEGNIAAIFAKADINANPDIILGGDSGNINDDGIIASDPSHIGSDIYLRSNDAVVIQLDHDGSSNSSFIIRDSDGDNVFSVNESGNATLSGSLTQNSDRRLKKNIDDLQYGLNEILKLEPKQYFWKDQEQDKKSLGLIAQDVQLIIDEIVTSQDDEQKTLGISYIELIPVLINAIKEQQQIINSQKKDISELKKETLKTSKSNYEALLSRIENLEANSSN